MDANQLQVEETIPASRKLGADVAATILAESSRLIVAKGKKVREWKADQLSDPEALAAMLGPTGNLRAPTTRVGKTVLVGFDQATFSAFFAV